MDWLIQKSPILLVWVLLTLELELHDILYIVLVVVILLHLFPNHPEPIYMHV